MKFVIFESKNCEVIENSTEATLNFISHLIHIFG